VDHQRRPAKYRADQQLVPGAAYVTWVGIDTYYYRPTDDFTSVFGEDHPPGTGIHPKAVLLSRLLSGRDRPARQDQESVRRDAQVPDSRPGVFNMAQRAGICHQDWRIEDNPAGRAAFRLSVIKLRLAHSFS